MEQPPSPAQRVDAGGSAQRDPGSGQSTTEMFRETGLQVLARLSSLLRVGRSYQPDNQVFVQQLEQFVRTLTPALEQSGEAVLVAIESDLYLNGVRIPVRSRKVRFHDHVLGEFQRRAIAGLKIQSGITTPEMSLFFRLFLQPDLYSGLELLTACLAQGTDHVLPAIHASTHSPGDDGEEDLPMDNDSSEPGASGAGSGGEGAPGANTGAPTFGSMRQGAARKTYSLAVQGARSLLMTTSLQGGMELRHAKRVVQPLVDGALSAAPVVVGLSALGHHDEYTYAHAVNVTLVAVTMGHFLELDRAALADLGVAALLHDVGKAAVADRIHHPLESFTPDEEALAQRHAFEGARVLAASTTLNRTTLRCIRVALEHHRGPTGDGYPDLGRDWKKSLLAEIVSVADCYVSLQTHRSPRGASVTPYEALGMMLGPLRSRFQPAMLWALVQTVGFYPPGQVIELDDGALGFVLAPNANDPTRPHVRVVVNPDGTLPDPRQPIDLRPLPDTRSVRRALPASEYPAPPENEAAA